MIRENISILKVWKSLQTLAAETRLTEGHFLIAEQTLNKENLGRETGYPD
jgi:hypothetical protein